MSLVYRQRRDDIRVANQRERNMKLGPRAWKVRIILEINLEWRDLFEELAR
jgi:putative endonuclease